MNKLPAMSISASGVTAVFPGARDLQVLDRKKGKIDIKPFYESPVILAEGNAVVQNEEEGEVEDHETAKGYVEELPTVSFKWGVLTIQYRRAADLKVNSAKAAVKVKPLYRHGPETLPPLQTRGPVIREEHPTLGPEISQTRGPALYLTVTARGQQTTPTPLKVPVPVLSSGSKRKLSKGTILAKDMMERERMANLSGGPGLQLVHPTFGPVVDSTQVSPPAKTARNEKKKKMLTPTQAKKEAPEGASKTQGPGIQRKLPSSGPAKSSVEGSDAPETSSRPPSRNPDAAKKNKSKHEQQKRKNFRNAEENVELKQENAELKAEIHRLNSRDAVNEDVAEAMRAQIRKLERKAEQAENRRKKYKEFYELFEPQMKVLAEHWDDWKRGDRPNLQLEGSFVEVVANHYINWKMKN